MAASGYQIGVYDPAERARQKEADRQRDDARLRNGDVSRAELAREVGFFSSLDLSRSKISRRRASVTVREA